MPWEPGTPAPAPEPPAPDDVLWVVTKGDRRAELAVRTYPYGLELCISVNGSLVSSELVRFGDGRDVRAMSDQQRMAFLGLGWRS